MNRMCGPLWRYCSRAGDRSARIVPAGLLKAPSHVGCARSASWRQPWWDAIPLAKPGRGDPARLRRCRKRAIQPVFRMAPLVAVLTRRGGSKWRPTDTSQPPPELPDPNGTGPTTGRWPCCVRLLTLLHSLEATPVHHAAVGVQNIPPLYSNPLFLRLHKITIPVRAYRFRSPERICRTASACRLYAGFPPCEEQAILLPDANQSLQVCPYRHRQYCFPQRPAGVGSAEKAAKTRREENQHGCNRGSRAHVPTIHEHRTLGYPRGIPLLDTPRVFDYTE